MHLVRPDRQHAFVAHHHVHSQMKELLAVGKRHWYS